MRQVSSGFVTDTQTNTGSPMMQPSNMRPLSKWLPRGCTLSHTRARARAHARTHARTHALG